MARHWYDLRVFTRDGRGGNPLAVVPDAVGISTEAMQAAATEIGYSETVYLDWAEDAPHPKLRIFTPASELPFAGHPLVGTAWLLANVGPTGAVAHLEPPAGSVVCGADERSAWIECDPAQSPQWRMQELSSFDAVATHRPTPEDDELGVFAIDWESPLVHGARRAKARFFFALGDEMREDPATGSLAVVVAAALRDQGRIDDGDTLEVLQGDEVARPSRILATVLPGGRVRLAGDVMMDGIRHIRL